MQDHTLPLSLNGSSPTNYIRMKLSDQVCTLEQAKKLRELGIVQESLCAYVAYASSWKGDESPIICNFFRPNNSWLWVSAFTVAELGLMLLPAVSTESELIWDVKKIPQFHSAGHYWHVSLMTDREKRVSFNLYITEAGAKADLLIYLLESGEINFEDCNRRLQAA